MATLRDPATVAKDQVVRLEQMAARYPPAAFQETDHKCSSEQLGHATRGPNQNEARTVTAAEPEATNAPSILAKGARNTAVWLGLDAPLLMGLTGLHLEGDEVPMPGSPQWTRSLALIHLGRRLKSRLGRRDVVQAWLRGRHLCLHRSPLAVLSTPDGLRALSDYLDAFER